MKAISTALQSFLLAATEFAVCDLLTITLNNGTVVHATNADVDVTWNSILWSSSAIKFGRSKTSSATGGAVADLQLELYADSTITIGGAPLLQAVRAAMFDGAVVRLDTLFLSNWATPIGTANNFFGLVSSIEAGRTHASVTVKAPTHLFDTQMPRNFYQPGCMHVLYDSGCTLSRASYAVSGAVQAGSGNTVINDAALTQASGYFTRGYLQFTSGQNNGLRYTVASSMQNSGVTLARPLIYPVATGDTFTIYAGCDRQQSTCTSKFNNLIHFKAYPYVPVPSTAV